MMAVVREPSGPKKAAPKPAVGRRPAPKKPGGSMVPQFRGAYRGETVFPNGSNAGRAINENAKAYLQGPSTARPTKAGEVTHPLLSVPSAPQVRVRALKGTGQRYSLTNFGVNEPQLPGSDYMTPKQGRSVGVPTAKRAKGIAQAAPSMPTRRRKRV